MTEPLYFHALRTIPGIGAKTLVALVNHFGSAEAAFRASESELVSSSVINTPSITELLSIRDSFPFDQEQSKLASENISLLPFTDPDYPKLLLEIPDFPPLLYIRGNFSGWNEKRFLSIIGSRKFTSYGKQVAEKFSQEAVRAGFVVTSGLAFGIDAISHQGALDAHGETIAILGSGINDAHISPQTNVPLAHRVMRSGALVSEYPPGTEAAKGTFPARNRIMAGLSFGTLVVEAADQSGTLITARLALDYNREVFAVPGSVFSPLSLGCHKLLSEGAKLTTSIEDILAECEYLFSRDTSAESVVNNIPINLTSSEETLLHLLSHEAIHIDNILKKTTLDTPSVLGTLTLLELKGLAKNIGGQQYIRM